MHHMQTVEQQAAERSSIAREMGMAEADASERGASRHEPGEVGELAHAAVLGYN